MNTTLTIALIIATVIPLACLILIRQLDFYHTGSYRLIILSFSWGVVAYSIAKVIGGFLISNEIIEATLLRQVVAPINEEILKGLLLIYLVRRKDFTYFVDGAIYGFAIGIGFAIFENYDYVLNTQAVMLVAVARVLSVNLIHAAASGLVGTALGIAFFRRIPGRLAISLSGLAGAILLHAAFNNLVTRINSGLLIASITFGLGALGAIILMIRIMLQQEKASIVENLDADERVTSGEAKLVGSLGGGHRIDKAIEPIAERFGTEKAAQCKQFLLIQAKLAIQQKNLERHESERAKPQTMKRIKELQEEMDEARREVGLYVMLFVRTIYLEGDIPLWGKLDIAIEETTKHRTLTGSDFNLFKNLDTSIKTKNFADSFAVSEDEDEAVDTD